MKTNLSLVPFFFSICTCCCFTSDSCLYRLKCNFFFNDNDKLDLFIICHIEYMLDQLAVK
jgi:hypothetical protein